MAAASKDQPTGNLVVFWHRAECAAWSIVCSLTRKPERRKMLFFRTVKLDQPAGNGIAAGIQAKGYG